MTLFSMVFSPPAGISGGRQLAACHAPQALSKICCLVRERKAFRALAIFLGYVAFEKEKARWGKDGGLGGRKRPLRASQVPFPPEEPFSVNSP